MRLKEERKNVKNFNIYLKEENRSTTQLLFGLDSIVARGAVVTREDWLLIETPFRLKSKLFKLNWISNWSAFRSSLLSADDWTGVCWLFDAQNKPNTAKTEYRLKRIENERRNERTFHLKNRIERMSKIRTNFITLEFEVGSRPVNTFPPACPTSPTREIFNWQFSKHTKKHFSLELTNFPRKLLQFITINGKRGIGVRSK